MGNTYGAAPFPSLLSQCVLHWNGENETINGFPIIPSGVTVTPAGTWANPLDLGNNKSVLVFNGSTNYIQLSASSNFQMGTSDFTIGAWIKSDLLESNTMRIVGYANAQSNDTIFTWGFGYNSGWGGVRCQNFAVYSGGAFRDTTTINILTNSIWQYVTVCKRSGNIEFYTNGVLNSSVAFAYTCNITGPLQIGHDYNAEWFGGLIKDLMIFKGRALTVPEIKLVMARTHPTTGTGMLPGTYDYYKVIS